MDAIGAASVSVHIKMPQVLQERTFLPVGSPGNSCGAKGGAGDYRAQPAVNALRLEGFFRDITSTAFSCSDIVPVPSFQQRLWEARGELGSTSHLSLTGRMCDDEPQLPVIDVLEKTPEKAVRGLVTSTIWVGQYPSPAESADGLFVRGCLHHLVGERLRWIRQSETKV